MNGQESAFRRNVKNYLKSELGSDESAKVDERYIYRHFSAMGNEGFYAECIDSRFDGNAKSLPLQIRNFCALIEELAKTQCFGLTITISLHVGVFMSMMLRLCTKEVWDEIEQKVISGEVLGSIAVTEANAAGSDFLGLQTEVHVQGNKMVLSGEKKYITNASEADYLIVFSRYKPGRHFTNFCAVLVPMNLPNIKCETLDMAVMRPAVVDSVKFTGVELDSTYLMGRKGLGFQYFMNFINVERLAGGIWATAVATQCLKETQRYATQRKLGADSLWDSSAVRHRFAQAVIRTTLLSSLVELSVMKAEQANTIDPYQMAIIKAEVAPAMQDAIGMCLQLRGAAGLETDSSLLNLYNEFRAFGIAGGTTETMLDLVAKAWSDL